MKLIKKSKHLIEDWSSGYNISGSLVNIKINSLKPKVLADGSVSFTGDIDCSIKDTVPSSYYDCGGKIYGEMECKIVSGIDYYYSLEGLEGEELLEALADDLAFTLDNLKFESKPRSSRIFDGKFIIESNYLDLNCKIVNETGIYLINKITRGDNYLFEVYDDKEGVVAVFEPDEEDDAIEYAKENNCNTVTQAYLNYTLNGDHWDYEHNDNWEVIWENDSI